MQYHYVRESSASKLGPVAASYVRADSCDPSCPLKDAGCYAANGHVALNWRKVPERGGSMEAMAAELADLPTGWRFRHAVAGDLTGKGARVGMRELELLESACVHLDAWTYSHKRLSLRAEREAVRGINKRSQRRGLGLVINLSANNLSHADELTERGLGPVVTVLPRDAERVSFTPAGRRVVACPASMSPAVTCATCGDERGALCGRADRDFIIGFPAHGSRANAAEAVALADAEVTD